MIDRSVVTQLLASYDSAAQAADVALAEKQRLELISRFPKDAWSTMTLDQYALGQAAHPDNFCHAMEFVATDLGSIKGGSARKHLIYFQAGVGEWWFDAKLFASVEDAWFAVRQGFVDAIAAGDAGNWPVVESIVALRSGPALVCKTLHVYFPSEIVPINSSTHLRHFLRGLGEPRADDQGLGTISLNRLLLEDLRAVSELDGMTTQELSHFLYASALDPFLPPVFTTPIPDVAGFIRDHLAEAGDDRLEARRVSEDRARRLLDDYAGHMTEEQVRELLRLFNADSTGGKPGGTRFSPGFTGSVANGLVAHLDPFNQWTERIWRGDDEESTAAVAELLVDRKRLPSAGVSYPTMLAYLRDPEHDAVWGRATDAGLRRLTTYQPRKASPGDPDDYALFRAAAAALMQDYDIPPEILDYVLWAAASYKSEREPLPPVGNVWLFQANPKLYDIDRALAEASEVDWVVRQYTNDVHAGDRVYLWRSGADAGVIATAEVLSEPTIAAAEDDQYELIEGAFAKPEPRVRLRVLDVLKEPLRRSDLVDHPALQKLGVIAFANATNFAVTPEQDAVLRGLMEGDGEIEADVPLVSEEGAASVFLPREWLQEQIVDLLKEKRQVVFYGPPGTGKTFVALELAKDLTRDGGRFALVQFHPSYSYEDFFEGYRPFELDGGAGLSYRLTPGPLRLIAEAAATDPTHPYVLIVDELNRGNVPKIFGELLFLLEYRNKDISLQYSPHERFSLPRNLFVIGTMNTADRSIALVDAALRRRFYFVPFLPGQSPVREVLPRWLAKHGLADEPVRLLKALNEAIASQEIAIGPSYFMGPNGTTPDLDRVWTHAIMPLLEEHYYGTGRDVNSEFGLAVLRKKLSNTEEPLSEDVPSNIAT
jgi:MoxR-like ATPase